MEDVINGYALEAPFQNKNAGFSRWTFAKKGDERFFIKEMLNPVYPDDEDNVLSDEIKNNLISICKDYEKERERLYSGVNEASDGNLVRIREFFRYDSHYYITTEVVQEAGISFEELAALPMDDKLLLCASLAHSMIGLEKAHLIHSDIKATNILLKKTFKGKIIGKIIDFDSSFFEDNPPENEDDLGGDQVYISPEALMFMCGEQVPLTTKLDVFAFGILFHQYLSGMIPEFDTGEYESVADAVLDGADIRIAKFPDKRISDTLRKMLSVEADDRPSMESVYKTFIALLRKEEPEPESEKKVSASSKKTVLETEKPSGGKNSFQNKFFFKPGGLDTVSQQDYSFISAKEISVEEALSEFMSGGEVEETNITEPEIHEEEKSGFAETGDSSEASANYLDSEQPANDYLHEASAEKPEEVHQPYEGYQSEQTYPTVAEYQSAQTYPTAAEYQSEQTYPTAAGYQSEQTYPTVAEYQSEQAYPTAAEYLSAAGYPTATGYQSEQTYPTAAEYQSASGFQQEQTYQPGFMTASPYPSVVDGPVDFSSMESYYSPVQAPLIESSWTNNPGGFGAVSQNTEPKVENVMKYTENMVQIQPYKKEVLYILCFRCGKRNVGNAKFCEACGMKL